MTEAEYEELSKIRDEWYGQFVEITAQALAKAPDHLTNDFCYMMGDMTSTFSPSVWNRLREIKRGS